MMIRVCFLVVAFLLIGESQGIADDPPQNTSKSVQEMIAGKKQKKGVKYVDSRVLSLFEERTHRIYKGKFKGKSFLYRLYIPKEIDPEKKYPLVLWLNGHASDDNVAQLKYFRYSALENQKEPFFVLAPQCPKKMRRWFRPAPRSKKKDPKKEEIVPEDALQVAIAITEKTMYEQPIDPDRVSIFGYGLGGMTAQEAAARRYDLFSAVACCSTKGLQHEATLDNLANVPFWAFHNKYDRRVRIKSIKRTVAKLKKRGGAAHLTIYPHKNHDAWTQALIGENVLNWLAKQKKGERPSWKTPSKTLWLLKEGIARLSALTVFVVLLFLLWRSFRRPKESAYA